MVTETRNAFFSDDRIYRYYLHVQWDADKQSLVVIGLNPSTADELKDDPTLRRVKKYAKDMDLGGVLMLNAFAYRSTNPRGLLTVDDPIGPLNTPRNIEMWALSVSGLVPVAAWGNNLYKPQLKFREKQLREIPYLDCFRKTKDGYPEHPLYLPKELRPIPWNYQMSV